MTVAFKPYLALAVVCLGAMLGPFDTAVNTAFPVITAAFGLPLREIQWVVIPFVLAQSSLTLIFGRLGDLFGYRRIFAVGLAASVLAHAAAAMAPDFNTLVAMRVLQGLAVGLVMSCGPALATLLFPAADKRRILALYVLASSLAMALGPWFGGMLIEALGWPGVFWFRVPVALAALALLPLLPRLAITAAAVPGGSVGQRFDWLGAIGLSAVMSLLILALAEITRPQAGLAGGLVLLLAGVVGAILFVRHESATAHPVLRMTPFRSAMFSGTQAASVLINFACFANLLLIPFILTRSPDASIAAAGLLLSFFPGGSVLSSLFVARLAPRLSAAGLMAAGLGVAAGGLLLTAGILAIHTLDWLGAGLLVSGLGLGMFQVGYMDATTSLLPPQERGVAGSLVSVTRLLGIVMGATGISWLNAQLPGFEASFLVVGLALGLFALGFALAIRRRAAVEPAG